MLGIRWFIQPVTPPPGTPIESLNFKTHNDLVAAAAESQKLETKIRKKDQRQFKTFLNETQKALGNLLHQKVKLDKERTLEQERTSQKQADILHEGNLQYLSAQQQIYEETASKTADIKCKSIAVAGKINSNNKSQ